MLAVPPGGVLPPAEQGAAAADAPRGAGKTAEGESVLLDAVLEGGGGAQEGLQAKEEKAAAEAKEEEEEEEDEKARSGDNGAAGGSGRYCKKMKKGKKTRGKGRGR